MNFDESFEILLGHEGVYSNILSDKGGETKYGISKRAYPLEDIPNLTVERAKAIYFKDYWGAAGCDSVPDGIKFDLFDMAVNSGVSAAIKTLQRTVGSFPDGVIGVVTLQAINSMPATRLTARFNGARLTFYADLADFAVFGRGWVRRIAANLAAA